jgi:hypothetical protein
MARHPKKVSPNALSEIIAYNLQKCGTFERHHMTESKKAALLETPFIELMAFANSLKQIYFVLKFKTQYPSCY